ncbi:hypothetical protein AB0P01_34505 [Streptomyces nigra]
MLDAGYDARIAHRRDGLPVETLGLLRSDRATRRPPPRTFSLGQAQGGQPPHHGGEFVFDGPAT